MSGETRIPSRDFSMTKTPDHSSHSVIQSLRGKASCNLTVSDSGVQPQTNTATSLSGSRNWGGNWNVVWRAARVVGERAGHGTREGGVCARVRVCVCVCVCARWGKKSISIEWLELESVDLIPAWYQAGK